MTMGVCAAVAAANPSYRLCGVVVGDGLALCWVSGDERLAG